MSNICKDCGLSMDFVGRAHRCVPRAVNRECVTNSMANSAVNNDDVANKVANSIEIMANKKSDVANKVANSIEIMANKKSDVANISSTYRYRDADKRRSYQRDYMRERRAKLKTDAAV